ncbi:MAG: N-acetyltransferase [Candidatus Eisenbacteria bacterium]|jgi:GNAT superfamily N-acetyltransferase|nr:N-acetyltransferase [Candidatus Eisenbacteria bacterium]
MSIEVREARSRRDIARFQRMPWRIYRGDPNWVPPLLSQERALVVPGRHPFHDHALTSIFTATDRAEVVGRIGVCLNEQHNVFRCERVGFFGFFESVNDSRVAIALAEAARTWLRGQGVERMRGPCNWSTNETCGLLTDGFGYPPMVMMTYNPPYYPALLEAAGFAKIKDLVAFELFTGGDDPARVSRIADRAMQRAGITIRCMDMKRFGEDVAIVRDIYNSAWSNNWGFIPMTTREFDHLAKEVKSAIDPRLVLIAEHKGTPAAFSLSLPNLNRVLAHLNGRLFPLGFLKALWYSRKISEARLLTLGVKEQFRRKGIEAVLMLESLRRGRKAGYIRGEMGWVLEDNEFMIRDIEAMGGRRYKTYRIYEIPTA